MKIVNKEAVESGREARFEGVNAIEIVFLTAELIRRMDYKKTNEKIIILAQEPSLTKKKKDCPTINSNFNTFYKKTYSTNDNNIKQLKKSKNMHLCFKKP